MLGDISIAALSSSSLLALTVLLILTGRLVPRITLREKTSEADRWRQAYELERTSRGIAEAQTNELLEVAKTTHDLIAAMSVTSDRLRQTGGEDVFPTT